MMLRTASALAGSIAPVAVMVLAGTAAAQGVVQLPRTGQVTCWDTTGATITCGGTGQDGDVRAGVSWPSPRFTGTGNCLTDTLTGLMWVRAPAATWRTWQQALDDANALSLCGHTDWRLPNINELESLVNAEAEGGDDWLNNNGFGNVQSSTYWSSTTPASWLHSALCVEMDGGLVSTSSKVGTQYAWPVRGATAAPAALWKTGQVACHDAAGAQVPCAGTGQDGEVQAGVSWPSPRFVATSDCVVDALTGLTWVRAPALVARTWQQALDYANGLTLCGRSDWRLPNRKELRSLIDHSQAPLSLPTGHPFVGMDWDGTYWSSTTGINRGRAVDVGLGGGRVFATRKVRSDSLAVPVRSGPLDSADLAVTEADSPDPATVGSSVTYTVTVANNGPGPASGVTLVDTLPATAAFVSAAATQGACVHAAGTVTCPIGDTPSGASVTVTVVVTAGTAGVMLNTASVTSASIDTNAANSVANEETTVNPAVVYPIRKLRRVLKPAP